MHPVNPLTVIKNMKYLVHLPRKPGRAASIPNKHIVQLGIDAEIEMIFTSVCLWGSMSEGQRYYTCATEHV